jgi:hypothetical protein
VPPITGLYGGPYGRAVTGGRGSGGRGYVPRGTIYNTVYRL